jgi:hypothetical protein
MKYNLFFLTLMIACVYCHAQRTITVKTTPADAKIMMVNSAGELSEIGTGTCDLKPGKEPVSIVVEKEER